MFAIHTALAAQAQPTETSRATIGRSGRCRCLTGYDAKCAEQLRTYRRRSAADLVHSDNEQLGSTHHPFTPPIQDGRRHDFHHCKRDHRRSGQAALCQGKQPSKPRNEDHPKRCVQQHGIPLQIARDEQ